ncbi:MAG: hypothetical protein KGD57_08865, partial [Candidatus Lokiarchaeota archaeon]|nr:hypothetical protein [Candidatus Lokiarchaeota archaeon]
IDEWGLNYIKKTRFYLKISAILPIYMIIIGIINLGFLSYMYIISIESRKVIPIHAIVVFTSFFLIFLFSLLQFLFLRKWKLKIREYGKKIKLEKKDASDVSDDKSKNMVSIKISLTDIFYDVVNHMEKIKILFIIINFFSAIYIFYNFMIFIRLVIFVKKATLMTFETLRYLNLSVSIVLILYLIYMWYHFTKWNKKLKKLKNYEKMIGQELNL